MAHMKICGSSSVVEYNLAKVGVAGSNPVFRSIRGLSSAGRAPALHAGGQRFDPARLHIYRKKPLNLKRFKGFLFHFKKA